MKKYFIRIGIIILALIAIEAIICISILPFIMTDEAVHIPKFLRIAGMVISCPLILINSNWPWGVKTVFAGISLLILNLLLQAHIIYLLLLGLKFTIKRR